jgi:hypothetical protein
METKQITKQKLNWKCSQNNHFFQKMWQFPHPPLPSPHKKGHVMEYSFKFLFLFSFVQDFAPKNGCFQPMQMWHIYICWPINMFVFEVYWCIKYFELMCSLKNNGFNSHYDNFQFTIDNMIAINVNLWLILNVYMIFKVIVLNHSA